MYKSKTKRFYQNIRFTAYNVQVLNIKTSFTLYMHCTKLKCRMFFWFNYIHDEKAKYRFLMEVNNRFIFFLASFKFCSDFIGTFFSVFSKRFSKLIHYKTLKSFNNANHLLLIELKRLERWMEQILSSLFAAKRLDSLNAFTKNLWRINLAGSYRATKSIQVKYSISGLLHEVLYHSVYFFLAYSFSISSFLNIK